MNEIMQQTRIEVTLKYPWWASIVLRLKPIVDENTPALNTDGSSVRYNPEFFHALTPAQRAGVLAHEAMHCAFLHHRRRGDRDEFMWNVACDYAINGLLLAAGAELPEGGLHDEKYNGLAAEEIYNMLTDDAPDAPRYGWVSDGDDGKEGDAQWRDALAQSLESLRRAGKLPEEYHRLIGDSLAPPVPWRELLSAYLRSVAGSDDYSWSRPSRRSAALCGAAHIPGRHAERCGVVGIAVDTSGSMPGEGIAEAVAMIRAFSEEISAERVVILEADAKVHQRTVLLPGEMWEPAEVQGGGGTSFIPALDALEADGCVVAVYITDLMGEFPDTPPDMPVIWLTGNAGENVPFGHKVVVS